MRKRVLGWVWVALIMGLSVVDAQGQSQRTVTMSRQVEDERSLDVNVRYGAGRFSVGPAEARILYQMRIEYDEDAFEPLAEYQGSSLLIGTETVSRTLARSRRTSISGGFPLLGWRSRPERRRPSSIYPSRTRKPCPGPVWTSEPPTSPCGISGT